MPIRKSKVVYCSWSSFKKEEWEAVRYTHSTPGHPGKKLDDLIDLEFRQVETREPLLRDLGSMVRYKAESAYEAVKVPCIVEHAGLILEGYESNSYPGGLTQPMWDALDAERFVSVCSPLGQRAIARAVIGYCDGMNIKVFTGEMSGELAASPRGNRAFYWDTIFCPDGFGGATYAEIVDRAGDGLAQKLQVSQSIKALKLMIDYHVSNRTSLFP